MITPVGFTYRKFNFPCGELQIDLDEPKQFHTEILWEFESTSEIWEIKTLADTLAQVDTSFELKLPYIPFSRQDRANTPHECFSLKTFAGFLNSLGAVRITVMDPHSDVATALIDNLIVIPQHEIFAPMLKDKGPIHLVSPDGGALKKIYKLAPLVECVEVIECSKHRNVKTGEISGVTVNFGSRAVDQDCYIVDDICDGGRTFISIAEELRSYKPNKIVLMVTHGFFTKGIGVFDGLIDEIYTRKGRIK